MTLPQTQKSSVCFSFLSYAKDKNIVSFSFGRREERSNLLSLGISQLGSRERDTITVKQRAADVWKLVRCTEHFNACRTTCLTSFSGSRIFHCMVIQIVPAHHLTLFCLFFLAFKQAEFTLHPDFHETWVPENSLQPWALPQSEPLLHDIRICSSISLSLLILPGSRPLDGIAWMSHEAHVEKYLHCSVFGCLS